MVGSTQSGKSYSEIHELLEAADSGEVAIVCIDPHPRSLAWNALQQLIARGHTNRVIWDSLDELENTPKYQFLTPSRARNALVRAKENHQQAEQFAKLLCRRRDQQSLASSPMTEEWTLKAAMLVLNQPHDHAASKVRFALMPDHHEFKRLHSMCSDPETLYDFDKVASGEIRPSQYAAAKRLIDAVCGAPSFVARCGTAFNLPAFFEKCGILLIQGGNVGQLVMQAVMGSVILQAINYARTRFRPFPRLLIAADEATNANLVGAAGHETRALAELQKAGLDFHVLVQSLNFPSAFITDGVLTNCIRHEWFYAANPAVARKAAEDLGDPELVGSIRKLKVGERWVKDRYGVRFEKVPEVENPWVFPELAEIKTCRAITEIYHRPEYGGNDECPPSPNGEIVTPRSPNEPPVTFVQPDITSNYSPAKSLRTRGSTNSDNAES